MTQQNIVFILGPPGVGKGTLCRKLEEEYDCIYHLSIGDFLREMSINNKEIKNYIDNGEMVPDDVFMGLMNESIIKSNKKIILVDGLPRTWNNWKAWKKYNNNFNILFFAVLETKQNIVIDRINNRNKTMKRVDDSDINIIMKRIESYNNITKKLINKLNNFFEFYYIDATNSKENVYIEFNKILSKFI